MRKTEGTYLVNHADRPLRFGEVNLINPPRRERRGRLLLEGVLCQTVCTGFCGTEKAGGGERQQRRAEKRKAVRGVHGRPSGRRCLAAPPNPLILAVHS